MTTPSADEFRSAADTLEAHARSLGASKPEWGSFCAAALRREADVLDDDRAEVVEVTLGSWSRRKEVRSYAAQRNVSSEQAIEELVNSGLSHHRSWT